MSSPRADLRSPALPLSRDTSTRPMTGAECPFRVNGALQADAPPAWSRHLTRRPPQENRESLTPQSSSRNRCSSGWQERALRAGELSASARRGELVRREEESTAGSISWQDPPATAVGPS